MAGILVIRLKGLGDIVHLIPSLERLRSLDPDMKIGMVCQTPFGDIIPSRLGITMYHLPAKASFRETLTLVRQIRSQHFSTALDFFGNPRTALICFLSGIPRRCGFDYHIRRYAYHETFRPADPNRHLTELFGEFLDYFGFSGPLTPARLDVLPSERAWVESWLRQRPVRRPLLGVNPHTTYPSKRWPMDYYQEIIKRWNRSTGGSALVFHGPGEERAARDLIDSLPDRSAFIHPPVLLPRLLALLAQSDLFLTGDTGPMNLAWALGTRTVALFGPTTRRAVAPKGEEHLVLYHETLPCLECHKEVCLDGRCMTELTPNIVWQRITRKYPLFFSDA